MKKKIRDTISVKFTSIEISNGFQCENVKECFFFAFAQPGLYPFAVDGYTHTQTQNKM